MSTRKYIGEIGVTIFSGRDRRMIEKAIGRIQACDYGKRAWEVSRGVVQVENAEQRDARVANAAWCDKLRRNGVV